MLKHDASSVCSIMYVGGIRVCLTDRPVPTIQAVPTVPSNTLHNYGKTQKKKQAPSPPLIFPIMIIHHMQ